MKNIRHVYQFHFNQYGIHTTVEIKGTTLREVYNKLLLMEPALVRLDDRSWNCHIVEIHKRRLFSRVERNHTRGFLPHEILSERDYNYLLKH